MRIARHALVRFASSWLPLSSSSSALPLLPSPALPLACRNASPAGANSIAGFLWPRHGHGRFSSSSSSSSPGGPTGPKLPGTGGVSSGPGGYLIDTYDLMGGLTPLARIDGYSPGGFNVGDVELEGPLLCLPSGALLWRPPGPRVADITIASLAILQARAGVPPPPPFLTFLLGRRQRLIDPSVRSPPRAGAAAAEAEAGAPPPRMREDDGNASRGAQGPAARTVRRPS